MQGFIKSAITLSWHTIGIQIGTEYRKTLLPANKKAQSERSNRVPEGVKRSQRDWSTRLNYTKVPATETAESSWGSNRAPVLASASISVKPCLQVSVCLHQSTHAHKTALTLISVQTSTNAHKTARILILVQTSTHAHKTARTLISVQTSTNAHKTARTLILVQTSTHAHKTARTLISVQSSTHAHKTARTLISVQTSTHVHKTARTLTSGSVLKRATASLAAPLLFRRVWLRDTWPKPFTASARPTCQAKRRGTPLKQVQAIHCICTPDLWGISTRKPLKQVHWAGSFARIYSTVPQTIKKHRVLK